MATPSPIMAAAIITRRLRGCLAVMYDQRMAHRGQLRRRIIISNRSRAIASEATAF